MVTAEPESIESTASTSDNKSPAYDKPLKSVDRLSITFEDEPKYPKEKKTLRKGKTLYSVISQTLTTAGIGILLLSYGYAMSGVIPGTIVIIFYGIMTDICLCMLVKVSEASQKFSYEDCAEHFLGKWGNYFVAITVMTDLALSILSLVIIGMTSFSIMFRKWSECEYDPNNSKKMIDERFECTILFSQECMGAVCILMISPFLVKKSIHAIRHASVAAAVGLLTAIIFLFVIQGHLATTEPEKHPFPSSDIEWVGDFKGFCYMVGLVALCFICQFQIFNIYEELEDRQNIHKVIHCSILGLVTPFYILVGLSGYFLLGKAGLRDGEDNIFDNLSGLTLGQIASVIVATTSIFKLPLVFNPEREMITDFINIQNDWYVRLPMTAIMLIVVYFVALYVSLSNVSLITGATTGTFLGFVIPGIYYMSYARLYGMEEKTDDIDDAKNRTWWESLSTQSKRDYVQGTVFVATGLIGGAASFYGAYYDLSKGK